MNKLTEIKNMIDTTNKDNSAYVEAGIYVDHCEHLLSLLEEQNGKEFWGLYERYEEKVWKCLEQADEIKRLNIILEEKDKALAIYADEDNWGADRYGCSKIFHGADEGYEIARKALNTSSNNEGEI